ncbi:hypothetical protein NOJ05_13540 [Neorhizobium galegae]|uniref:hypothetical protein n=1 Tax=Neorhizobium galegae TaxID=399 RepID=UPI0021067C20|nr:hypothetical protein [Neorhizobium galegae]MCQ1778225.1 hypothetical protein [Neorhizobium galegae]MCQ1796801.1 hypothetical protein [Neorhizobium galegae]
MTQNIVNAAPARLSSLFSNPALKAAFERAERDNGAALVVPAPVGPRFIGGAGASLQWRQNIEALELA